MSVERPDKARTRNFSLPASSVEAGFEDREGDRNGILLDRRHAIMDASSEILPRLRIAGGVLRGLFIVSLLIVTMHVCMPQREHVWTAYASPADLIRMILGLSPPAPKILPSMTRAERCLRPPFRHIKTAEQCLFKP
jgi:hypothetical protein